MKCPEKAKYLHEDIEDLHGDKDSKKKDTRELVQLNREHVL